MGASGALLLGLTVRFITGLPAGILAFAIVLVYTIAMDQKPWFFFFLSLVLWSLVLSASRYCLTWLCAVPMGALLFVTVTHASMVPVVGLFLASAVALLGLAYRGWANKRIE